MLPCAVSWCYSSARGGMVPQEVAWPHQRSHKRLLLGTFPTACEFELFGVLSLILFLPNLPPATIAKL
jgi:hypothetical protein